MKNRTRARRARTPANIASVAHSVEENPGLSIPHRSLELGVSQTTLHRILHKNLCLKAYKVQLTQELKPADHQQRRVFVNWVLKMHENEPDFHRKIIMSDDAHFHLGGYVNKQNCRIWGSENPKMIFHKNSRVFLINQNETFNWKTLYICIYLLKYNKTYLHNEIYIYTTKKASLNFLCEIRCDFIG